MYYVLGSGHSGVACAQALLDGGASVSLIDVGRRLEPEKRQAVETLAAQEPENWDPALAASIKGDFLSARSGLAFKPAYASDFPYAQEALKDIPQNGTKCLISHAAGGLSNVWGAATLPYRAEDFRGWPVGLKEMAPHYEAAAKMLKIAARRDDLEALFPFYAPCEPPPSLSRQARSLLDGWQSRRQALRAGGIVFGQSRLALTPACKNVGLCLSGCPYSAIYNAAQTLETLLKNPRFRYLPGLLAEKAEETEGGVRVRCRSLPGEAPQAFDGQRLFVACGALATAKLLANSLGLQGSTLTLRYQPYFLLPLLMLQGGFDAGRERLHTLAQLFLEILDPAVSVHPVHLQLYTFNEFYRQRLSRLTRGLPFSKGLERPLLDRLAAVQGYLHSSEAGGIAARVLAGPDGARLELSGRVGLGVRRKIGRAVWKILMHWRALGALPLPLFAEVGKPGEGNHIGAVFPMAAAPRGLESDRWGRVGPLKRVHAVDASVLTDLPATTLAYTSMANAHRIAAGVLERDLAGGSLDA